MYTFIGNRDCLRKATLPHSLCEHLPAPHPHQGRPLKWKANRLLKVDVLRVKETLTQVGEVRRGPLLQKKATLGLQTQLQLGDQVVVHQSLGRLHTLGERTIWTHL